MQSTINRISDFIQQESLLLPESRVIVGLSGGADSVALLSVLVTMGYECIACHCNFMLRGDESMRDRDHAERIALQLQVPFVETTFDTVGHAQAKGFSIEMAARELRYEWFEQMRIAHRADAIAVAHHRDDNTETLLLNLIRGTGIAGVTGMSPRNGMIIRPLLCVSRDELIEYLSDTKLSYVTDSTNLQSIYTRNKIRLEVMPLLRDINPAADSCIERSIAHLRSCEKYYRAAIDEWRKRVCIERNNTLYIDLTTLHTSPDASTLLFEIAAPLGFNASQIADMAGLTQSSGRQFLSATHRAVSHRDNLIIEPISTTTTDGVVATWSAGDTSTQHRITPRYCDAEGFSIIRDKNTACFDLDQVKFPLTLRHWQQGDTFIPFGMRGRKKVSDYFNDHKYSLIDKENALLLCDSEKILWIVGERTGNEARITDSTRRVLVLKYDV